jgi:hypothetical protein
MRTCSECGKNIIEGYVVKGGEEYYCTELCLFKHYTPKQWKEMSSSVNDDGEEIGNDDNYWTEWDDELDEYFRR